MCIDSLDDDSDSLDNSSVLQVTDTDGVTKEIR